MTLDSTTQALLHDPKKRRDWVHFQLKMQGRSMAEVARNAEPKPVARQTLYQAFLQPYPRMEKLIADALGLTPQQLFPERYDRNGLPVRRKAQPHSNATKKGKHNTAAKARNIYRGEAV